MKKEKAQTTININKQLKQLCKEYGLTVEELFIRLQKDMVGSRKSARQYQQILAELYLTEVLSEKSKVDRSSIESALNNMKSYKAQRSTKQPLPEGLSKTTKQILKASDYRKNHSKN
jgi:phosphate starvation-inducible protein PhoH